jgi:hypothetical protein
MDIPDDKQQKYPPQVAGPIVGIPFPGIIELNEEAPSKQQGEQGEELAPQEKLDKTIHYVICRSLSG